MRNRFCLIVLALLALPLTAFGTVTGQTTSVSFACTGSTGPYPFSFAISDPTALTVIQGTSTLAPTSYTVTPVNNNYANGGSVTLSVACPTGATLVLQRNTPLTQGSIFTDNMPLPFKTMERALDKLTEIDQEIAKGVQGPPGPPGPSGTSTSLGNGVNVLDVTTFAGATADAKFSAACAALPGGGVLDARGFGPTTQAVASTISCGGPSKSVTFLFDRSTVYQPTTASTNMFQFSQGNTISGLHIDTTNQTAYSGLPISNASQSITHFSMAHTFVNMATDATSPCMEINSSSALIFVQFSDIDDFYCNPGLAADGMLLTVTGPGWINANNWSGIRVVNAKYGIHLNMGGAGGIGGNVFTDYEYEASQLATALAAVYITIPNSGGGVYSNQFSMNAWDLASGGLGLLVDSTAKSCANSFKGIFNGASSVSDNTTCAVPDMVQDIFGTWGLYQNQGDMRIIPGNTLDIAGYEVLENSAPIAAKEAGGTVFTVAEVDNLNTVEFYADPTEKVMNFNTSPSTQCLTLSGLTSTATFSANCALAVSGLVPGNCVQAATGSILSTTGAPCGSGGAGNVTNSGTPTTGQLAEWTNETTIEGISTIATTQLPATIPGGIQDTGVSGQVINVKSPPYGATGSGSTSDTAAVNLAIAYCNTNGGTLYFPTGNYLMTATPTAITNRACNVQGVGRASTIMTTSAHTGIALLKMQVSGFDLATHNNYIHDLSFNCNSSNTSAGGTRNNVGIWMLDSAWMEMHNVTVTNCLSGILQEDNAYFEEGNNFDNIEASNNTAGFTLQCDTSNSAGCSFEHSTYSEYCQTQSPGDSCFHLDVCNTGTSGSPTGANAFCTPDSSASTNAGMTNETIHVEGNLHASGACPWSGGSTGCTAVFLLDAGGVWGSMTGQPEVDAGTGYAFFSNLNTAQNSVTASGLFNVSNGGSLFGGTWTAGYQFFHGPGPNYMGTLTTTTGAYDQLTNNGIAPGSRCFFTPTNSIASLMTSLYIDSPAANWGFVYFHHPSSLTAGGNFDFWCY